MSRRTFGLPPLSDEYRQRSQERTRQWRAEQQIERSPGGPARARAESFLLDGAKIAVVAFGTAARVSKTAIQWARKEGIAVGMLRPITLFPFPEREVFDLAKNVDVVLVIEMNTGQMVEDVRQSTPLHDRIAFLGKPCAMPTPEEILERIRLLAGRKG